MFIEATHDFADRTVAELEHSMDQVPEAPASSSASTKKIPAFHGVSGAYGPKDPYMKPTGWLEKACTMVEAHETQDWESLSNLVEAYREADSMKKAMVRLNAAKPQ